MIAALAMPLAALAQTAYKGRVYVANEQFARQGNLLHIKMRVYYTAEVASPGETLTLTPILKSQTDHNQCSSVVVKGDDLKGTPRLQANWAVAQRYTGKNAWKRGVHSYVYDTTVPWHDWYKNSSLYMESMRNNGRKDIHTYEDLILKNINIKDADVEPEPESVPTSTAAPARTPFNVAHSDLLSCVQYLMPASDGSKVETTWGVLPLTKKLVHSKKLPKYVYEHIISAINELGEGRELFMVRAQGFSAPEGYYRRIERLGVLRQLGIKEYFMEHPVTSSAISKVLWTSEDWDSIANIVRGSEMAYRDAVLDIIETTDVVDGREDNIKNLAKGKPYDYLRKNVFSKVYRLKYALTFRTVDNDLVEGAMTSDNKRSHMTYSNLFGVAQGYGANTDNFLELMDLGPKLFPNSPEANINGAAAAMVEGKKELARKLLEPYATDPRAYCNLGVLNMLEGNLDKAEVYLNMAKKNGSAEAAYALGLITVR